MESRNLARNLKLTRKRAPMQLRHGFNVNATSVVEVVMVDVVELCWGGSRRQQSVTLWLSCRWQVVVLLGVGDPICGVKSTIAAISDLRKDGDG